MRKPFRLVLALSGVSLVGATFLIACGDDTEVTTTTEAGTGTEAGKDSRPPDDKDAGVDAADADQGDTGIVLANFDEVLATEQCKSLARCCYGTPTPGDGGADGGTFDMGACVAKLSAFGFQGSNVPADIKDGGNVALDQVKAKDCVDKIKVLKCDLPGSDYTAARTVCFGAYVGKLAAGQPCKSPAECQAGHFCKAQVDGGVEVDGGTGTCTAIRGVGGACGDNPNSLTEYEEACSYRGGGGSGNYCKWGTPPAADFPDAGDWKCAPAGNAGAGCYASTWCTGSICDETTLLCRTPDKLFDSSCTAFLKP